MMRSMRAHGEIYVDRGDPAVADWDQTTLTADGVWHDLDLSAIVPLEAAGRNVELNVVFTDDVAGELIMFRENGNVNGNNVLSGVTQVNNIQNRFSGKVTMSNTRIIEYWLANAVWAQVLITVRGWWIAAR